MANTFHDAFHIVPVIPCIPGDKTTFLVALVVEDKPTICLTPSGLMYMRDLPGTYGRYASMDEAQAAIDAYEARQQQQQQHDQGAA